MITSATTSKLQTRNKHNTNESMFWQVILRLFETRVSDICFLSKDQSLLNYSYLLHPLYCTQFDAIYVQVCAFFADCVHEFGTKVFIVEVVETLGR